MLRFSLRRKQIGGGGGGVGRGKGGGGGVSDRRFRGAV